MSEVSFAYLLTYSIAHLLNRSLTQLPIRALRISYFQSSWALQSDSEVLEKNDGAEGIACENFGQNFDSGLSRLIFVVVKIIGGQLKANLASNTYEGNCVTNVSDMKKPR